MEKLVPRETQILGWEDRSLSSQHLVSPIPSTPLFSTSYLFEWLFFMDSDEGKQIFLLLKDGIKKFNFLL